MKTSTLFYTLIFLFSFYASNAQYADEGNEWFVTDIYPDGSIEDPDGVGYNTVIYKIQGDSLIGEINWKKLFLRETQEGLGELVGFVREDSLLIHHRDLIGVETLIYNFGFEVGDSYTYNDCGQDWEMIVDNVSTTMIDGEERALIEFALVGNMACCLEDTWIEGVGSLKGPLFTHDPIMFACEPYPLDTDLSCFHANGDSLPSWQNPFLDECFNLTVEDTLVSDWAPVGAVWHYGIKVTDLIVEQMPPHYFPRTMEIVSDTIIQGISCKRLVSSPYGTLAFFNQSEFFIYKNDNKVWYYNIELEEFKLLYDTSLEIGETWEIITTQENAIDTITMIVEDKTTIMINNHEKVYMTLSAFSATSYVEIFYNNVEFNHLIEDLGFEMSFFPWYYLTVTEEFSEPFGLRCYEDSTIGFYQHTEIECDANYSNVKEFENESLSIYPNPVQNTLNIEFSRNYSNYELRILNLLGEVCYSAIKRANSNTQIDVSKLPSGIYFLEVTQGDETMVQRFVKE